MTVWYNDSEPFVVAWLKNLIAAGLIPAGDVDDRPIQEVQAADLHGYTQCHFFAGIGGWAYALQLAGWGDRPVWTGSCPCQPFSAAGKRGGTGDARHLWPAWADLIRECRPPTVFGEQVAGPDGVAWFDAVSTDLEGMGYAVGAADLCAAGVGAPHLRQRLWFVGHSQSDRDCNRKERSRWELTNNASEPRKLADTLPTGRPEGRARPGSGSAACGGEPRELADTDGAGHGAASGDTGVPQGYGTQQRIPVGDGESRELAEPEGEQTGSARLTRGNWDAVEWLPCRDGKARSVEPGTFPLAHGIPARVGRLRAYGNAIVPACAAEFVSAYMDVSAFRALRDISTEDQKT